MPEAIKAQQLTKSFDDLVAVDHFDVTVETGEIFGLVGPDGAGKTTTLRLLTSVLEPSGGDAWVAGRHTVREAEAVKESIGYMSQRFGLYLDLTVLENINFYADLFGVGRRERREATERLLEFTNLAPFTKRLAGNLSGGMKQRLALGCAILHEPSVIFLDEPTAGVDPISRRQFWDLIYELAEKHVTIFVTTHYMDEAEYCDRIGFIYHGELIALGAPRELKTDIMRDRVLEVRCDRPQEALDELAKLEVVSEAALFGRDLHVVVRDEQVALDRIGPALTEAGYAVRGVEPITPSLEDVFVSLIESYDREHSQSRRAA